MKVRRALLSVSDKTGIVDFARGLVEMHIEILSTGGTASLLRSAGVEVKDVAAVTGFPEILGGRIKTLHPLIHGGLLGRRDDPSHVAAMDEHGIPRIDLLCCNLYPFEQTVARADCTLDEALDQIDIGGPAMIRAAAKNFLHVATVTSPLRYPEVLDALRQHAGALPEALLADLARAAFKRTAQYDAAIANHLAGRQADRFPNFVAPFFEKVRDLRYGENPFQKAALYRERGSGGPSLTAADVLWGKEPSYNNLVDLDSALRILREFEGPTCVVIKHTNPCGLATAGSLLDAFRAAMSGDPMAAYGCVLGFNEVVDAETAKAIADPRHFVECILAPGYAPAALQALTSGAKWGKSVRLLKVDGLHQPLGGRDRDIRRVLGGVLVQEYDERDVPEQGVRVVSKRQPTDDEMTDLRFAWRAVKHVSSNAIVFAKGRAVVGVGAGQMSRLDSARIAVSKAGARAKGAVLACDAFFPFADAFEACLTAGVAAAIQPGGSRNDHEVIAAADAHDAVLVFTGMRHFRH